MEHKWSFQETCRPKYKWKVDADLKSTSCEEYPFCSRGRRYPLCCHETKFGLYEESWWLSLRRKAMSFAPGLFVSLLSAFILNLCDNMVVILASLHIPSVATNNKCPGKTFFFNLKIPRMQISVYGGPINTLTPGFWTTSNKLRVCRSPIYAISAIMLESLVALFVDVLNYVDLKCLMKCFIWCFKYLLWARFDMPWVYQTRICK